MDSSYQERPSRSARPLLQGSSRGLAAFAAVGLLALGPLYLGQFQLELVALALLYGLFAFGLDLAWGRAGIVSIGHAIFFGAGAYGVGIAVKAGIWIGWGWLGGIGTAMVLAAMIGAAGLRPASSPSTMAVLTLAISLLAEKAAIAWSSVTGGSNGLFVAPPDDTNAYYWSVVGLITVVVCLVKWFVLDRRFGNRLTAIRLNERRAEHMGIPAYRERVLAFTLGAMIAAVAGAMAAPLITTVTPDRVGVLLSTQALVWVALGGRATILGPFVGAVVAVYGQDALAGVLGSYYLLLLGILFVLSVLFMPQGIVGLFDSGDRINPLRSRVGAPGNSGARGLEVPELEVPELEIHDLVVRLGGNTIIDGLDFSTRRSEIVCIIGPNGAGKSTLLNTLSGQLSATSGTISFRNRNIEGLSPDKRATLGLARTFQVPSLFPQLSVSEHLALARQEGNADAFLPARYRLIEERRGDVTVEKLSLGDRRLLEISMALYMRPDVLLLDEPAAGLARHESELLVKDLKEMRDATGCAVICVEHDMELVRTLADRVVCLHQGRVLSQGTMEEVSADENVRNSYLGRA